MQQQEPAQRALIADVTLHVRAWCLLRRQLLLLRDDVAAAQPPPPLVSETKGGGGWAAALSVLGEARRVSGVRVVGFTCVTGANVIRVAHVTGCPELD